MAWWLTSVLYLTSSTARLNAPTEARATDVIELNFAQTYMEIYEKTFGTSSSSPES
jgi:hypothetical protein